MTTIESPKQPSRAVSWGRLGLFDSRGSCVVFLA
jgi:hypothetical protein